MNKRFRFFIFIICFLIFSSWMGTAPAIPASAATNLLQNPGFEQGYANWDSLVDFAIKGPGHNSNNALYIQSLERAVVQQCIPISQTEWNNWIEVQGRKYIDVDGWIKTDQYIDRVYIEIWNWTDSTPVFPCNGAGSKWHSIVINGSQDWTKISQASNAFFNPFGLDVKPAAVSISLVVEAQEGAFGTAAFDDLSLTNVYPGRISLNQFSADPIQPIETVHWLILLALILVTMAAFYQIKKTS